MKIRWELNKRVKSLVSEGKITQEDVIEPTQAHNFPPGTCTVRIANPNAPKPRLTLHIRGKSKIKTHTYSGGQTIELAETCRVNIGGEPPYTMCSKGKLDEDLTWLDVHNLVEKVKEVMDM